jgi:hypothetical protein
MRAGDNIVARYPQKIFLIFQALPGEETTYFSFSTNVSWLVFGFPFMNAEVCDDLGASVIDMQLKDLETVTSLDQEVLTSILPQFS